MWAELFDTLGRRVAVLLRVAILLDEQLTANQPTRIDVKADILPRGLYLVHVRGDRFTATRRLTVVR